MERPARVRLTAVGALTNGTLWTGVFVVQGGLSERILVWVIYGLPCVIGGAFVGWFAGGNGGVKARVVALWSAVLVVAAYAMLPVILIVGDIAHDLVRRTTGFNLVAWWMHPNGGDIRGNAVLYLFGLVLVVWVLGACLVGVWFGRRIRKRSRISNATDTDHPPVHRVGLIRHVSPHGMLRRPWSRRR
jgi:hypothetical protein